MKNEKVTHCVCVIEKSTGAKRLEFKGTAETCLWFCSIFEEDLAPGLSYTLEEIELGKYDGGLMLEELLGTPIRKK